MNEYVTYCELKEYKGIPADQTEEDGRLRRVVIAASRAFDRWTWRHYYPLKMTRPYDYEEGMALKFGADLLEALTVTTQNGAITITADQYFLLCGRRYDLMPYDRLELRTDKGVLFSFAGTKQQANAVTGIWGYHGDYPNAWEASGDSVQNATGLTDSGTSLIVADADGPDLYGLTPRFRPGQILKVEDEFLYIRLTTGGGANTLIVQRGFNGTTAASHAKDKPIFIWRPWMDVWENVRELAAYLYDLKDSQVYDVTATPETGMMVIPKGIPAQVKLAVQAYRRY